MALQVWLPLDGDLKNYGIGTISNIRNNGVLDNNGKIGKCYGCSKEHLIECDYACPTSDKFSIAMWLKIPSTHSNNTVWETMFMFSALNNSTIATYSYSWASYQNLKIFNTQDHQNWWLSAPVMGGYDKWIHLTVTNEDNTQTLYINGQFYATKTNANKLSIRSGRLQLGAAETADFGHFYFNDVRIYDHCLSPKEVKEISKGLVLHYRLSGVGGENLFQNTHFDRLNEVTAWDTSKNGNYTAWNWGGYNSGVANPASVYHAHLVEKDGSWVYNYHRTSAESWLGISQNIYDRVIPGKTYTFSCELYRISGVNYPHGGFYTKANSSATSYSFVAQYDISEFTNAPVEKWIKYSKTITLPSTAYIDTYCNWYIYGHLGGLGEFLMRHPKLEEGSKPTPWLPNPADPLYSTLGLNNSIEYDCSGYKHNGTKIGTIVCDSDTPRYSTSYRFKGVEYISISNGEYPKPIEELTVSWWGNMSNWNNYQRACSCTEGGGWNFETNSSKMSFPVYQSGVGYIRGIDDTNLSDIPSGWHHWVSTFSKGIIKFYRDGELKNTYTSTSTNGIGYANTPLMVGCESPAGSNYVGNLSDFRIYSTALSDSDVKELYNSGAWITANAAAAYELREE